MTQGTGTRIQLIHELYPACGVFLRFHGLQQTTASQLDARRLTRISESETQTRG
jgi:hypothetical protein